MLADFLRGVVETEYKLISFLTGRNINVKRQHAVTDTVGDDWCGEPTAVNRLFAPLTPNDEMTSWIGGGILFEQPRAIFVKFNLQGKITQIVNDFGKHDVGFGQNRLPFDGDEHGVGAKHGNVLARAGGVGTGFDVHTQGCGQRFLAGLAAASQSPQECQRQIDVESSRQNFHSGPHKTSTREQSKDTYGQTIQQS